MSHLSRHNAFSAMQHANRIKKAEKKLKKFLKKKRQKAKKEAAKNEQ